MINKISKRQLEPLIRSTSSGSTRQPGACSDKPFQGLLRMRTPSLSWMAGPRRAHRRWKKDWGQLSNCTTSWCWAVKKDCRSAVTSPKRGNQMQMPRSGAKSSRLVTWAASMVGARTFTSGRRGVRCQAVNTNFAPAPVWRAAPAQQLWYLFLIQASFTWFLVTRRTRFFHKWFTWRTRFFLTRSRRPGSRYIAWHVQKVLDVVWCARFPSCVCVCVCLQQVVWCKLF